MIKSISICITLWI